MMRLKKVHMGDRDLGTSFKSELLRGMKKQMKKQLRSGSSKPALGLHRKERGKWGGVRKKFPSNCLAPFPE